jgi:hypothetical protein
MEERAKFDNFHRRAAGLVRQLVVQTTKDKKLNHRSKKICSSSSHCCSRKANSS